MKCIRLVHTLSACAALAAVSRAPGASTDIAAVESRLAALEQRLATLETENAHLRGRLGEFESAPKAIPAAPTAADQAGRSLRVSGYTQIHAEWGGTPDPRWNGIGDRIFIRRADIALRGKVTPTVDFKIESELSSGTLSARSGHTPRITDAYVRWTAADELQLWVGQFKTPYGRAQLRPNTQLPLVERPLASDRQTFGRQVGAAVAGNVTAGIPLSYVVGLFNGTGANASFTENSRFMTAGRLSAQLWQAEATRGELAVNAIHFDPGVSALDQIRGWGVDGAVSWRDFGAEAEYLRTEFDSPAASRETDGWWVATVWTPLPHWQGVIRYGNYDPDTRTGLNATRTWTFGVNWLLLGDDLKLSLNYLTGEQPAGRDDRFLSRVQLKF